MSKPKKHSSDYYISQAEKHGLKVEHGKGSHTKVTGYDKVTGDRTVMVIPRGRDLAPGTENKIRKWFMRLGIILALLLLCYGLYLNQAVISAMMGY